MVEGQGVCSPATSVRIRAMTSKTSGVPGQFCKVRQAPGMGDESSQTGTDCWLAVSLAITLVERFGDVGECLPA